ncbi:MAG: hypothetical protein ACI9U2_004877, partial [Bradymonadia bacterium]
MGLTMRVGAAMAIMVGLTACQQDAKPQGEAETHWLDQCDVDADCGDGLCVCGVCTEACGADDLCLDAARPACANVQQLALVCGAPAPVCVRACAVDADCGAGDFECSVGVCIAADLPEPEPDAPPEPEPDAPPEPGCEAACERVEQCFAAECTGSPYGDLGAACLQTCADLGAAEFEAQFVCTQGLTEPIVPGLAEACVDPEFVADCSMVGSALTGGGDPFENARRTADELDMHKPRLRAVYDKVLYATDAPTGAVLDDLSDWLLSDRRVCEFGCTAPEVDATLSAIELTASYLATQPSHAAQQLTHCLSIVARRFGWVQYGFTASVCGDTHGSSRAVARLAQSLDASAADMLCVTRNAYELCQTRYLGAESLVEPGRCSTCTVGFGESTYKVPTRDT